MAALTEKRQTMHSQPQGTQAILRIICMAESASVNMTRNLCTDWLLEPERCAHLAFWGFFALVQQENDIFLAMK